MLFINKILPWFIGPWDQTNILEKWPSTKLYVRLYTFSLTQPKMKGIFAYAPLDASPKH